MKKKWIAAALVCALALTGGCGKSKSSDASDNGTGSTASGIAGQYPDSSITKLGNYKGVEIAEAFRAKLITCWLPTRFTRNWTRPR